MELEEARNKLKRLCEYENNVVLTGNELKDYQKAIKRTLKEIDESIRLSVIKQEINNLKLEKNKLEKEGFVNPKLNDLLNYYERFYERCKSSNQ